MSDVDRRWRFRWICLSLYRNCINATLNKTANNIYHLIFLLLILHFFYDYFSSHQVLVGHTDIVTCVAVSITNKTQVVSGSWDYNLIVWDINTGSDVHLLSGHLGKVTCVKVTGDGTIAVSGMFANTADLIAEILIDI